MTEEEHARAVEIMKEEDAKAAASGVEVQAEA